MTMHLLRLKNWPIAKQLQLEEHLLRKESGNWCILNEGSSPAIVLGISGKESELLNAEKLLQSPIPVIRRFSGGGTVVIDENCLFATFICQKDLFSFPPYPEKILEWSASFYQKALDLPGFHLRENDYVIGERKCGGNAQYIRKERWLHHTSFLWSFDPQMMDYLLLPKKRPLYRENRSHAEFLCTLKPHLPQKEEFFSRIKEELCKHYDVCMQEQDKATASDPIGFLQQLQ